MQQLSGTEAAPAVADLAYWLLHAQGFAVDGPDGRLGTVIDCERAPATGAPQALVVRDVLAGSSQLRLPLADVAAVEPRRRRILVGARAGSPARQAARRSPSPAASSRSSSASPIGRANR